MPKLNEEGLFSLSDLELIEVTRDCVAVLSQRSVIKNNYKYIKFELEDLNRDLEQVEIDITIKKDNSKNIQLFLMKSIKLGVQPFTNDYKRLTSDKIIKIFGLY